MPWLGIEALSNPLLLAKRQLVRSMLFSSYDRRGGNHDWSNYLRREGSAAVMMESDGPGVITRIWTADPQKGTVRIFIDRNPVPAIEMPFAQLFDVLPLSSGIGGESPENYERSKVDQVPMGRTTYCPIPFQSHCKVTIEPEDDYLYYHINAHLHPPGTALKSFDPLAVAAAHEVADAVFILEQWQQGKPVVDMSEAPTKRVSLNPEATIQLLDHAGAGIVRGVKVTLPKDLGESELRHLKENLWLVAHFDDDEVRDPSIRAPIGPMFLDYGQDIPPGALYLGTDSSGHCYCYFPMPHRERASISIVNRSILPVDLICSILHEPMPQIDEDLLRFRASWHVETPFGPDHRDYNGVACRLLNLDGAENVELLYVHGAGHFVGCGFEADFRQAPTDRAACEGDEMFFIDDDPRLTMYGTGLEDYLNDAWGMRGYIGPLSGDGVLGETEKDIKMTGYRLHVPDPVPFVRKGRFTLEHGTGNNCSGLYRSVAYWYMDPSTSRTRIEERRWEELRTGKREPNQA